MNTGLASAIGGRRIGPCRTRICIPASRWTRRFATGNHACAACYPVETILEYLAGGDSTEDLLAEFPDLEREDTLACHEFARRMLAAKSVHVALQ